MGMFSMRETSEGVRVRETEPEDPRLKKALDQLAASIGFEARCPFCGARCAATFPGQQGPYHQCK